MQDGVFAKAEEAERPFAEVDILRLARCCLHRERLIHFCSGDGEDHLITRLDLDRRCAADFVCLLQVKVKCMVLVAGKCVCVTQRREHMTVIGQISAFDIGGTPKARAAVRHRERKLLPNEEVGVKEKLSVLYVGTSG